MANILQYDFMQRALLVGGALGIIVPLIGVIVTLKRLSMIGDALSHSSLAGVSMGLAFGFNPVLGAVIATLFASYGIESVRKRLPQYQEMSIAIILSLSIGLAGIFSGFIKNASGFNSFLFGSIVAISDMELYLVLFSSIVIFICLLLFRKELFLIALDERTAYLLGVPVARVNLIFTILTAITVALASRTVGTLIISSIMVIPVASSMMIAKSYKETCIFSVIYALTAIFIGLVSSFYLDFKPGATIVMCSIIELLISYVYKKFRRV